MTVDVGRVLDWVVWASFGASIARVGVHWLKGGLAIWIEPGASFWTAYSKLEDTLAWLSISLSKFGKRDQVAADSIKDLLEHPKVSEVDVTVTSVEAQK